MMKICVHEIFFEVVLSFLYMLQLHIFEHIFAAQCIFILKTVILCKVLDLQRSSIIFHEQESFSEFHKSTSGSSNWAIEYLILDFLFMLSSSFVHVFMNELRNILPSIASEREIKNEKQLKTQIFFA